MLRTHLTSLTFLAAFGLTVSSAYGTSLYVDQSVASSGDGSSWATAFKTIGEGIEAAEDGDEVIVGEGTYVETVGFTGKAITVRSTDPTDSRIVGSTVIEFGVSREVVRFRSGEGRDAVIAGFTIASGHVGIACAWSCPIIRNNVIVANTAENDEGGGISCYYASPLIETNVIASNRAFLGGGGIACEGGEPAIVGNLIIRNGTDMEGGGILSVDCSPIILRNRIIANEAQGNGGGISCLNSQGRILNNLIVFNTANSMGGGIASYSSASTVVGNTIAHNSAQSGAGGIHFLQGAGTVVNSILWGNGEELWGGEATFSCIQENDPPLPGEGNIHDDPAFEDPDGTDNLMGTEDDDYRLAEGSPCLDKGSFAAAVRLSIHRTDLGLSLCWHPGADLTGQSRISGHAPDMGCHERQGQPPVYVLQSSLALQHWSLIHEGADTEFFLPASWPEQRTFFRLSIQQP